MESVAAIQEKRRRLLLAVYERVQQRPHEVPDVSLLALDLGLERVEAHRIADYWREAGALRWLTPGTVQMTHAGTNLVEALLTEGDRPPVPGLTVHNHFYAPANVAVGTTGPVTQTVGGQPELAPVLRRLEVLAQAIAALDAPEAERAELAGPVIALAAELQQPAPRRLRLGAAWGGLQALATVEGVWQGWDRAHRLVPEAIVAAGPIVRALLGIGG